MFRRHLFILCFIFTGLVIWGETSSQGPNQLVAPVYPASSPWLVYVEGEDAVSTNFTNQAVFNFGCSGYRAIQLNRSTGLQGGAPFYAEFVFYIEEAGEYEFWYGGTPPGPEDELGPSYASPFTFMIDGGEAVSAYRENIHVVEGYSPSYYWNNCGKVSLSKGPHRFRIEVAEKRGYDGRFFLYLDSLFFINRNKIDEIQDVKPEVFPEIFESSEIDKAFLSINDYLSYIDAHPDELSAYIELSLVYSLVGDYQSALKTLNRAMALDSSNPYPVVLAAKNRLWKGDVKESLSLYNRALAINPDDSTLWAEAGKVAAWTAEYAKSIDFFTRGLEQFPDDLTMRVNLGLTYLWMSRDDEAEETFRSALELSGGDPVMLGRLGSIEEVAGYPEYAQDVYTKSIELYPAYLEFYLLLQESYLASGDRGAADEISNKIESTFIPSERLRNELDIYNKKLSLRDEVIASYLKRLKDDPGNLGLRQELAQTYFWNGMKKEAIEQISFVITTYSYQAAWSYGRRNPELLSLADLAASAVPFFSSYGTWAKDAGRNISNALSSLTKNTEDVHAAKQKYADAVAAGRFLLELEAGYMSKLEDFKKQTEEVVAAEKTENEAFRQVVASSGWSWDKSWQTGELGKILESEKELASFMLGRVLMSEANYAAAEEVLRPSEGTTAETPADGPLYAYFQAVIFSGQYPDDGIIDMLASGNPHVEEVREQFVDAYEPFREEPDGIYYEGLEDEAVDVLLLLEESEKEAVEARKTLSTLNKQLAAVMERKLERANYYLESETYLIRYELGNYYLDEGANLEAAEQFRRVIAIDPWNISAIYKLGVVEQRYGHWSDAMKFYKKVYQQDPSYENAASYYNQLEKEHADKINSTFLLNNTPSEISYSAGLSYLTEINSFLGAGFKYSIDQQRLYREYEGEEKGYFQMHLVEAEVPFTLLGTGVRITPKAGVYVGSIYYKTDYDFSDNVSLSEYLKAVSSFPKYGVAVNWKWNFVTVDGLWERAVEADTFYGGRDLVSKNDFSINANTWFDFGDIDLLGPLTTRTYGRIQFMDDDNIRGQIYQDVMLGLDLLSNPVIRVSPGVSVNFETSSAEATGYYAPRGVLEAKGNLRSSFTFPSADWSSAFEAVLWGGTGGYWTGIGIADAGLVSRLKVDGGLGLNFVKNGNVYSANISGLGTFMAGSNDYWEFSVSLGTSLGLPALLTR